MTKDYTVFKSSNGEPISWGSVLEGHPIPESSLDEIVLEGIYLNVYLTKEGNLISLPGRPSEAHFFDYNQKLWIDPRTPETEWPIVRAERNQLLQQSDWTQLPDVPLATKEAWAVYRQALRDITNQPDPFNIVWPTPPQ